MSRSDRRYNPPGDSGTGDAYDRVPPRPDLSVQGVDEIGRIYGPDGETVRVVKKERPPFGFHREPTDQGDQR